MNPVYHGDGHGKTRTQDGCPISIEMSPVLIALELSSPGAATFASHEAQPRVTRMLRHPEAVSFLPGIS